MFSDMQWLTLGSPQYNQQFGQANDLTGYTPPQGQFQIMPGVISNMIQGAGGIGDPSGGRVDNDGNPIQAFDQNGQQVTQGDLLNQKLAELGISRAVSPDGQHWAYVDSSGQPIQGTVDQGADPATGFWNMALAMGALAGGAAGGAFGGAGGTELPSGMDLAGDAALGSGNNAITAGSGLGGGLAGGGGGVGADLGGATQFADGTYTGGAAGGEGAVGGNSNLAALYSNAGYGAPMSGLETSAYDTALKAGAAVAGGGGGSSSGLIPGISNGSLLSTGASLANGLLGSSAANNAANAQLQAGQASNALQKSIYDQSRADFAPYLAAGTSALGQIQSLLANPNSITTQPGYQFGLDQGTKARNNGAAAKGMTYSGAQGKALTQFGQDYAGTKLNDSFNRLASVAGIGQTATNASALTGQNYGQSAGNTLQGMGNSRASGYIGGANAWGGALGNALGNYQNDQLLNRLFPGYGG